MLFLFSCILFSDGRCSKLSMDGLITGQDLSNSRENTRHLDSPGKSKILVFCGFYLPLVDDDYYSGERWEFREALCVISPMSGI